MVVAASYYALFAVMGGSLPVLAAESIAIAAFLAVAMAGYKRFMWLVAALAESSLCDALESQHTTLPNLR